MPQNSKSIVAKSSPEGYLNKPKVNFDKGDLDTSVWQHGYSVYFEKMLYCPCKPENESGGQSNCQNCGGTGFVFVNKYKTRMILSQMNMDKKYEMWSEIDNGDVNVTAQQSDQLGFMDRITVVDGESRHQQILYPKVDTNTGNLFAYTIYNIKKIFYIALYEGTDKSLKILKEGTDYTIDENIVYLDDSYKSLNDISLTIRYIHAPQFHIVNIGREIMNAFVNLGGTEKNVKLPINAIARRSHYMLDAENIQGTRLFDNSDLSCEEKQNIVKC